MLMLQQLILWLIWCVIQRCVRTCFYVKTLFNMNCCVGVVYLTQVNMMFVMLL